MGGRGAYSSGGDGLPAKFRDVLGRKGTPRDVGTALKTANPKFNDDKAYRINCQRCVWAYELQRRGYKVQARGNHHFGDEFNRNGYREVFDDAKWEPVKWTSDKEIPTIPKRGYGSLAQKRQVSRNIEEKMSKWGEGSRAAVVLRWAGTKNDHAFSVENIGWKAYVVDSQIGKKTSLMDYIGQASAFSVSICRTDSLKKPNYERMKQAVKPI